MASLTGQLVAETYKALLKTIDNDILTASEKQITDGFGGGSNVFIDSQGFLRANKYKVTNGLATQFLKADGSLDANTYLTGITSSQIITALGYTPVTNARTLTINGTTYDLSANRSWTIAGTAAVWGNISGTLSDQTDLQNALNAKFNNPTGTISQYIRGDGTLATLPSAAVWGNITGTLSAQTDLQSALDAKFDDPTGNSTQYIDGSGNLQTFPTMLSSDNLIKLVRNQSGATMTAGTIVYINGATGNKPTIAKALATSDATSAQTYGMVQADIANNADGYIVVIGNVNNLNTHSLTEGAQLYLSATTAGAWTTTKQYAPNHLVYVGIVLRSHPNQGIVGVKIQNGYEMDELHDVSAQTPSNNDGLFYETSTSLWKNKSIADALGFVPQRLDKMVSNLLASSTEYPNSNAVIAALALKANAENPVFTGNMTISGAEPKLYFTDTDQNPDYFIGADAGFFRIYDQTAGATRFVINSSGVTTIAGDLIAGTIAKSGGTATQFLKADGSIDSSTYVTSASLANYLLITTAASTYQRLDKMVSNLLASDTEYPNSNAVLAKLALKADAANPVFTGDMTISGIAPKLYFTDTDNNPDYTIFVDSGYFYIYDQTAGATKFQITPSGNAINTGTLTSASFIKSGGTSSQFLMADGSVSTGVANTITGSLTSGYVPKATGANTLGNSLIYDNGSSIGIGATTLARKLEVITGSGVTDGIRLTYANGTTGEGMDITYLNTGATTTSFDSIYNSAAAVMQFRMRTALSSPTIAMTIFGSGNVHLGSQTDSGFKFYVSGTGKFTDTLQFSAGDRGLECSGSAGVSFYSNEINSGSQGITGDLYFGWRRTNNLNFGVTSNFSSNIIINGAGSAIKSGNELRFYRADNGIYTKMFDAGNNAANGFVLDNMNGEGFHFKNGGNTIMRMPSNGFVGIGINSPEKLLTLYSSAGSLDTGAVIRLIGNAASDLVDFSVTDTKTRIYHQENSADADAGYGIIQLRTNAAPNPSFRTRGGFQFTVGSTDAMTISNTYTIGMGITPDAAKLSIQGVSNEWALSVYSSTTTSQGYGGIIRGGTNSNDISFRINNAANSTTYFTMRGDGLATYNNMVNISSTSSISAPSSGKSIEMVYRTDGSNDYAFIQTYDRTNSIFKQLRISGNSLVLNGGGEGNVLINTTTDNGQKLQVSGSIVSNSATSEIRLQGGGYGANYNASFRSISGAISILQFGNNGENYVLIGNTATGGRLDFRTNCSSESISSGSLAFRIDSNATATFYSNLNAVAFFESSDSRLKKLIDGSAQVSGIENLEAKLYEKNGKIEMGYFAQDAEKLMPYAVTKNEDGFLNLSYREVHTAKIARLEQRVAELEKQLNLN